MQADRIKDLVEYMVRPIVGHPDDVQVTVVEGTASVLCELRVNDDDLASVRGPKNQLLRSMQQILSVAGGARKPVLDLIEASGPGVEE